MDVEAWSLNEFLEYTFSERVAVSFMVPMIFITGGFMDGFIEKFHDTFGLGNMNREEFPRNDVRLEIVKKDGTTVHATLEVTVNKAEPTTTVESFYAVRTELLGDSYRLVRHEALEDVGAISTLYSVETHLAGYLERTVYFVQDEKTYIYKFNALNRVYYAIEPWIDEIVTSFFGTGDDAESDHDNAS
ncbi:MAG: DUF3187 family protein [SAR324 cluster bacterium]|nr:DUF3187 family protein [SAR324 cluster bacterium]